MGLAKAFEMIFSKSPIFDSFTNPMKLPRFYSAYSDASKNRRRALGPEFAVTAESTGPVPVYRIHFSDEKKTVSLQFSRTDSNNRIEYYFGDAYLRVRRRINYSTEIKISQLLSIERKGGQIQAHYDRSCWLPSREQNADLTTFTQTVDISD